MRTTLPAVAVLAVAALTLGACNNRTDNTAANDTMADTAATMPADNTLTPGVDTNATVDTNTMTNSTVDTNTMTNTTTNTTY